MAPEAPRAARRPVSRSVHGVTLTDDYAWLKAENWREVVRDPATLSDEIRAYLEAENAYADAFFAPHAALRTALVAEMRGRIKEDDASVPAPDGPYAYYSRYRDGGQHPLFCRKSTSEGEEELLLDGDALAAGLPYFRIAQARHAPDHRRLAYSVDTQGGETFVVRIRDLAAGSDLPLALEGTTGDLLWSQDASHLYYIRLDAEHRPSQVYRHRIGTDPSADVLIYEEADKGFFISLSRTRSGAFGLIACGDHETSEVHLIDLSDVQAPLRLVAARESGVLYEVSHHPDLGQEDTLVILTNADKAVDFKIVTAPTATPARPFWRDLVPHKAGRTILDSTAFRGFLVRLEREDGLPRIVIRTVFSSEEHAISFAEDAYALDLAGGFQFDTNEMRFVYSSMTTPEEVWAYDMHARGRTLLKRQVVPSGHEPSDYVTRRIFAKAPDGETVPVTLLHRASTSLDGTAPCLLYGYGAYGLAMPASFSTTRLSLVDRGFVYAIAHVRGGTEKGWRWYLDGKLDKKTNTFTDFIAAAAHLRESGMAGQVIAHGASAGGMLMGAVANMRPELFDGIVAQVPFVDVLSTMLDDSLPLTPPEWPEWGNPIESETAFHRIRSYSPVDNVAARAYPAILALGGLTDPRVTYWEPARWVARLREVHSGPGPLLLRTNMDAGHGGAAGRFERLEEIALVYAFALAVAGKAEVRRSHG